MYDNCSINELLLAGASILGGDFELAVFNALEILKNHGVDQLPIDTWSEDLLISMLAFR